MSHMLFNYMSALPSISGLCLATSRQHSSMTARQSYNIWQSRASASVDATRTQWEFSTFPSATTLDATLLMPLHGHRAMKCTAVCQRTRGSDCPAAKMLCLGSVPGQPLRGVSCMALSCSPHWECVGLWPKTAPAPLEARVHCAKLAQ